MTNTILIAVGVVIPLAILVGGAAAFIWYTEKKRKEAIAVREIPYRPRITSFLYRNKDPYATHVEDGIEVCSPRPSLSKNGPPALDFKLDYELPSLQIGDTTRSDSAVQSPTDTLDQILELEGTLGKQLSKPPSKAKLRHSSEEPGPRPIKRKELPNRASLQPHERYYARHSLQPIMTTSNRDRLPLKKPSDEMLDAEIREGTSSPTVSAISEISSGRGLTSPHSSDVPGEY